MATEESPDHGVASGCYGRQSARTLSNRSDGMDENAIDADKRTAKGKKESRYYAQLERGSSEEELVDTRSKPKKTKVFAKLKDRGSKDENKRSKGKTKGRSSVSAAYCGPTVVQRPIFGVTLAEAVRNGPSHDGVPVPAVVRLCIDYITEHGLKTEGIYRIPASKAALDALRFDADHKHEVVFADPYIAAGLLKLFLRELTDHVFTTELADAFESAYSGCKKRVEWLAHLSDLVDSLPLCNKMLLAYIFSHMDDVVRENKYNKMTLPCVGLVLQPALNISQGLLNCFLQNWRLFFKNVTIKKYVMPLQPWRSNQELPTGIKEIEEELAKQESVLNYLHGDLVPGEVQDAEKLQELWDVQRFVTQLKRELKRLKKESAGGCTDAQQSGGYDAVQGPCLEMFEEKQLLAVQMQLREQIAAEQQSIDYIKRIIADLVVDEKPVYTPELTSREKSNQDGENKKVYQELEEQRDQLIANIIEERYKCAHLRARIEMLSLAKQNAGEATRL